jgi:phage terminase small subunit
MPRARLPTELKQLRGTYRADRANPKEPKAPKQEPPIPRHLSPIGKKAWRQACDLLSGMGVLTQADAFTIEALAEAYADLLTARAALAARGGLTYETTTPTGAVMVRPAPEVSMVADAD